jgi:hypothetical protein
LRTLRVVFQGLSKLGHGHPEAIIKILDVGILPHLLTDFFPGNDFTAVFQQYEKNAQGLVLESDHYPVAVKFTCADGEFEVREPEGTVDRGRAHYLQSAPRGRT